MIIYILKHLYYTCTNNDDVCGGSCMASCSICLGCVVDAGSGAADDDGVAAAGVCVW